MFLGFPMTPFPYLYGSFFQGLLIFAALKMLEWGLFSHFNPEPSA